MYRQNKLINNQNGFASIVIALVLILVLGLITVGFAQLARREQQDALNKQLSNQAYYAAESAVNQAYYDIYVKNPASITTSSSGYQPNVCLNHLVSGNNLSNSEPVVVNSNTGTSYTCVMLNLQPNNLGWSGIAPETPETLLASVPPPSGSTTSSPLSQMNIQWTSADGHETFPAATEWLLPESTWNPSARASKDSPPVLQFSITPLGDGSSTYVNRNAMIANTMFFYLYPSANYDCPTTNSNAICTYANVVTQPNSQAPTIGGGCRLPPTGSQRYECSATINLPTSSSWPSGSPINVSGATNYYYLLHFVGYYDSSNVMVTATTSSNGPITNLGGEAMIDATGQARNVLRRIQVRVSPPSSTPYAIEAQNICKRAQTAPINSVNTTGTNYYNGAEAVNGTNDPCNLSYLAPGS